MLEPNPAQLDVVVASREVEHEVRLAPVVHPEDAPLRVQLIVEPERKNEAFLVP